MADGTALAQLSTKIGMMNSEVRTRQKMLKVAQ